MSTGFGTHSTFQPLRRYPFVFAETGPEQLTVCIDEGFPGFNGTEGETLFQENGEVTPFS